jgi:hypothetical protein
MDYNRRYFGSRLPTDLGIVWEPTAEDVGSYERWANGEKKITLDPKYALDSRQARMTLLHEMVHVEIDPVAGHGKLFQEGMIRLALAGAFRRLW